VEEPLAVDLEIILARVRRSAANDATRERLLSLTLAYPNSAAAWSALAAWATLRGDIPLYARSIAQLTVLAPTKRPQYADAAAALAGDGQLREARLVAGALADASGADGLWAPTAAARPLVARLAVDDAIARNDAASTRLRATRTHLGLDVAAARAALAGRDSMALALADEVLDADPHAVCARAVVDALSAGNVSAAATRPWVEVPLECEIVLARAIADGASDSAAARVFSATPHAAMPAGDALVTPLAAALAARGIMPFTDLAVDAKIELCARRGEVPAPAWIDDPTLDARHRYLALALAEPTSERTARLSARLAAARATDALVAVGWAREGLARGRAIGQHETDALLALAPGDPIALAVALDVAKKGDDVAAASRARASLSALARTPAERARVTE
jgi:hypothetical protein